MSFKSEVDIFLIHSSTDGKSYVVTPPLGLTYIAATLLNKGYSVKIIDNYAYNIKSSELVELIRKYKPAIIGISLYTASLASFLNDIKPKINKEIQKGNTKHLIVGGYHVNFDPDIIKTLNLKYGAIGDGVISMPAFADLVIKNKGNIKNIPGLIYRKNGKYYNNKPAIEPDFDKFPLPARNLLDNSLYFHPVAKGKQVTSMITQLGCPYRCFYCSGQELKWYRQIRKRNISLVVDEIEFCIANGFSFIDFYDVTFTLEYKRTMALLNEIIKRNLKFKWSSQTTANSLDEKLVQKMSEAGCVKIAFGLGTGNESLRNSIVNKKISDHHYENGIKLLRKYNIASVINTVIGFPTEHAESIKQTYKKVCELDPDFANFFPIELRPASKYHKYLQANKYINEDYFFQLANGKKNMVLDDINEMSSRQLFKICSYYYIKYHTNPKRFIRAFKHTFGKDIHKIINNGLSLFAFKRLLNPHNR